jgi:hypothetical protein
VITCTREHGDTRFSIHVSYGASEPMLIHVCGDAAADHGTSPVSIIEIPQLIDRVECC